PIEIEKSGDVYKYYYGSTSFASKRDFYLRQAKNKGFPDAFVAEFDTNGNLQEVEIKTDLSKTGTGKRIQILTSQRNYRDSAPQLKGIKPIDKIETNGLYRYYHGWFASEAEAKKALTKIHASGFPDAFIVDFVNGKKK
ncbi:MAG: SPOR domain-containing protein, partial [Weeksellaceae bacterium]